MECWQNTLGLHCLYTWLLCTSSCACGISILTGLWDRLEQAVPISSRQKCLAPGCFVFKFLLALCFFQCWLILNSSSLVCFKRKYRTVRDLPSRCPTVSKENSPFSLAASSLLGYFCNLFSSRVSKSSRLPCSHHCWLGGWSMTLLLWELQPKPLPSFKFPYSNVCACLSLRQGCPSSWIASPSSPSSYVGVSLPRSPCCSACRRGPPLCQENWALALKVVSSDKDTLCFVDFMPAIEKNLGFLWPVAVLTEYVLLEQKSSVWEFSDSC